MLDYGSVYSVVNSMSKSCKRTCNGVYRGRSIHPFCNHVKREALFTECTTNREAVAVCNLVEYKTPLDASHQVTAQIHFRVLGDCLDALV